MAVNLNKGGRINLSKEAPGLKRVAVGLGWDINNYSGVSFDLDASVFLLGANGKTPAEDFFIFYNNLKSPDGSVEHTGDNRTGVGAGDDETILIDLSRVRPDVTEIIFVASIHDASLRRQSFGQVRNAFIRLYDLETNQEVAKYELDEDFHDVTGVEFGRLYVKDNEWRFHALGQGHQLDLQGFVDKFV